MSTVVGDITAGVETSVQTALSFTASNKLRHVFNFEKNDFRTIKDAYGIIRLGAAATDGVTRVYTLDHGYEVLLTGRIIRRDNDDDVQTMINTLYDRATEVLKELINTKAGNPANVLNIFNPSFGQPELFEDNSLVLIRVGFTIKFRESLN